MNKIYDLHKALNAKARDYKRLKMPTDPMQRMVGWYMSEPNREQDIDRLHQQCYALDWAGQALEVNK